MSAHVTIEFDQPRRLLFNIRAMKALQSATGDLGVISIMRKLEDVHHDTLERVLWAGLLHEEPTLTVNLVSKRLQAMEEAEKPIGELFVKAIEALNSSKAYRMPKEIEGNGSSAA